MTGFAAWAELVFVAEPSLMAMLVIVCLVAGDTGGFEFLLIQETGMTGIALGRDVFAAQRVFGVSVVVKNGNAPVFFRVAGLAFLAEPSLVAFLVVVCLVAGDTGGFEFLLI